MSEFAQALAIEEHFTWDGKEYTLAGLEMEVMGQFELWLAERAWKKHGQSKAWLPGADYAEATRILQGSLAAGDYDFFSEFSLKAQEAWEGRIFLAWARVHLRHVDFKLTTMREIFERDVDKVLELKRKMAELDRLPNSKAPATTGATETTTERSAATTVEAGAGPSNPFSPSSPASPGAIDPGKSAA